MATATNTAGIQYGVATTAGTDVTHYGLFTAASGGTFLLGDAITGNPSPIAIGERYQFAASALVLTLPEGDFTPAAAARAIQGFVDEGTVYVSLHSGDPGGTGASELTDTWYSRQSVVAAGWTVAQ